MRESDARHQRGITNWPDELGKTGQRLGAALSAAITGIEGRENRRWLYAAEKAYSKAKRDKIPIELIGGETLPRGRRFRQTAVEVNYGRLLYSLIVHLKPRRCIELGTSLGGSTLFQAAALEACGRGELVTLELHQPSIEAARDNLARGGIGRVRFCSGRFQDTLDAVLEDLGSVDYAFIDGHHKKVPTLKYFAAILERATLDSVVVFDDITWSSEMVEAWDEIVDNSAVDIAITTPRMGICLLGNRVASAHCISIDIPSIYATSAAWR